MTLVICATLLCFYPQLVVLFALNLKCIETEKHNKKKVNGCGAALPRRGNQPRRGCNCCEAAAKPHRGVGDAKEPKNQKKIDPKKN